MAILVAYITFPDRKSAEELTEILLQRRMIACANIFPVQSAYWWQGDVVREDEIAALVKTRPELETELEETVLELHPYQTPCIMRFKIYANSEYERWIEENTDDKNLGLSQKDLSEEQ